MIERTLVEYMANALWQVPMLAGGAWLLLAAVKAGPRMQHGVWLMVLGLAVVIPLHGMGGELAPVRVRPDARVLVGASDVVPAGGDLGARGLGEKRGETALRPRRVEISVTAARWVVGLYAGAVMFGLWRVVWAWRVARRLVERSREVTLAGEQTLVLEDYGRRLRIRLPQVRESVEISSPMIVGVVAPVLLLPVEFARYGAEEMRAALLHELAHVKRRDTLENAVCQWMALPVSWHPVTQWVQGRIRRTREMVCDAMAAEEMRSEIGYARCLVALAKGMMGRELEREMAGVGLFHSNVLEERVMRLMERESIVGVRTRLVRVASGAVAMAATIAVAAMFHLTPTMAQEQMQAPLPEIGQSAAPRVVPDAAPQTTPNAAPQTVPDAAPQAAPNTAPQAVPNAAALDSAERKVTASGKEADVVAGKGKYVYRWEGTEDEPVAIVNGRVRKLTPEERRQIRQQMEKARKEIAQATAKINSPEFRKQIAEAAAVSAKVNSAEFRKQIEEAQLQAEKANEMVHSQAFKEQMQKMEETLKTMDLPRIQAEVASATAEVNSPEFKRQMAEVQREINGEVQQRVAEAMRQMEEAQEGLKAASPK